MPRKRTNSKLEVYKSHDKVLEMAKELHYRIHLYDLHPLLGYGLASPMTYCARKPANRGRTSPVKGLCWLWVSPAYLDKNNRTALRGYSKYLCYQCAAKYKSLNGRWPGDIPPDPKHLAGPRAPTPPGGTGDEKPVWTYLPVHEHKSWHQTVKDLMPQLEKLGVKPSDIRFRAIPNTGAARGNHGHTGIELQHVPSGITDQVTINAKTTANLRDALRLVIGKLQNRALLDLVEQNAVGAIKREEDNKFLEADRVYEIPEAKRIEMQAQEDMERQEALSQAESAQLEQFVKLDEREVGEPLIEKPPRRFFLQRIADETGISGTGRVADGVEFPDGTVVMRWRSEVATTVIHESILTVEALHVTGHAKGANKIVWIDP